MDPVSEAYDTARDDVATGHVCAVCGGMMEGNTCCPPDPVQALRDAVARDRARGVTQWTARGPSFRDVRGRDRGHDSGRPGWRCPQCFVILHRGEHCPNCRRLARPSREYNPAPDATCKRCHGSGVVTVPGTSIRSPATYARRCPTCDPS